LAESQATQSNAVIRVIGDRASGKTTYMASLARWPSANPASPVQSVSAVNEESEELISKAQNILEQGLELEPSALTADAEAVKDYSLTITLKNKFSIKNPRTNLLGGSVQLNISCKDYAGEFFTDLLHQFGDAKLNSYLEDCLQATGIMFLLDGSTRKDLEYAIGIEKFLKSLDKAGASELCRLALVLTKCEQPDLWDKRHQPKRLANARYPQVCDKLKAWQSSNSVSVDFFTTSAFGMVGNPFQEANSKLLTRSRGGTTSILREPKHWRPFGLVAPIYWLCTGERHKQLDED
jgi:hypothetical protein